MQIILASQSIWRKHIMDTLGLDYEIIPSNADESCVKERSVKKQVLCLAELKTQAVAEKNKNAIIIAADSLITFNRKILGKPKDKKDAYKILKSLSGKTHKIHTGLCVLNTNTNKKLLDYAVINITFRKIPDKVIKDYVQSGICLTCAGGYGKGACERFIAQISGDYTCLGGLPVQKLARMLKQNGVVI